MRARLISGLALCMCGGMILVMILPLVTFAASSQTVIRAFVGVDTTPPSAPALVSVTPVATSQISLLWTASIDDIAVAGYRVFRDGSQIATTTLTSFNDTGLAPATVYQYTVDAFDVFTNISSTSAPVSTSTFALLVPATTTPTTRSGGTRTTQSPAVSDIVVVPGTQSASIRFKTAVPAQYSIAWGRTTSYELGSLSTSLFTTSHDTTIDTLEPGTTYWYKVVVTAGQGRATVVHQGSFTTLPVFVTGTLMNVRNVAATVRGMDVSLRWLNPELELGSVVRVVRSHLFYPATPDSGALVYEGTAERVQDAFALGQRSPQYYTLFVIDAYGNYSSGAVVRVVRV